jgi:hypothetical protein
MATVFDAEEKNGRPNVVGSLSSPNTSRPIGGGMLCPGIVETQNRIEMRLQPFRTPKLIGSKQPELTEHRLGLIFEPLHFPVG